MTTQRVKRFDIGELRPPVRLDNGWMKVDGVLTRSGVFEYLNPDGSIRREYRPPDEVFRADALASFSMVPLTNGHPNEPLTAENTGRYQVGTVGERVVQDGSVVRATLMVTDATAVKSMENGRMFLSCGYDADLDLTPGVTPEGERYDGVQRNIVGNHVALVDVPRAGSVARVRLDSADTCRIEYDSVECPGGPAMPVRKIHVDSAEVEVPEAVAAHVEKLVASVEAEKARADAAASDLAKTKAELEAAPAKVRAELEARLGLEATARTVLGEAKFDGKTAREVKLEVLAALDRRTDFAGKSDTYVDAAFDIRVAEFEAQDPAVEAAAGAKRNDEARADSDAVATARAKFHEALKTSHQRKG